jgi:hypothetical protein
MAFRSGADKDNMPAAPPKEAIQQLIAGVREKGNVNGIVQAAASDQLVEQMKNWLRAQVPPDHLQSATCSIPYHVRDFGARIYRDNPWSTYPMQSTVASNQEYRTVYQAPLIMGTGRGRGRSKNANLIQDRVWAFVLAKCV